MHTDSPHDPTLLEAARRGNSDAIARLIQQSLAPEGLSVQAQVTKTQLSLILDGEVQTHSAWLEALIQSSIQQLALPTIDTVQVQWPTGVKGDSTDAGPLEPSVLSLHPPIQVQGLAPDAMAAIAQPFIDQPASQASSKLIIGPYQSQWTEHGIAVTAVSPPESRTESRTGAATLSSPWRKRRHVADRYRCPPITRLLNRQNEMKAAIATLQAGGTIEFHGEAGAGKSALLRALGHHPQITPRFPGGIVYQQTYDQPVEDILQGLFEATYEVAPVTPSALATASLKSSSSDRLNRSNTTQNGLKHKPTGLEMQQMLSQHRICLVLDEMALSSRQLQLLSQWSNLSLLVSNSRSPGQKTRQQETKGSHRFDLPQHRQMSVKGLPLKDAIVLFEEGLGRSLQPGEEQDTETLCACLGGHPRRLVQMAALVRHRQSTLSELVEQLNQGTAPEAIILRSVSSLPESERRIVAILAAFNGKPLHGIHLPPLADLDTVAAQLTTLVNQGLVWTDGQFYRLADNLLPPLQEHWNLSPWADQALTYFKRWLAHLTPPQNHLTPNIAPQGQYLESTVLPICENSETLFFLLHHGIQEQKWTEVLELSALMEPGLWWGQRWGRWYQTLVIQWQAAQVLQDQRVEARILHQIGSYALCSGYELMAQTCLIQSLDQRLELGDLEGAAISQYNLRVANISVDQIQQTASLRDRLEQTATAQTPDAPMETPSTLSAALVTDRESGGAVGTSAPLSTGPSPSRQSETTDVMNGTSTDPRPLVDQEGGATTDPVEPSLHSTQESTAPDMPDVEQGRIEFENAAVLDGRWPAWIWLVLGAGTLGIVGLIALLLGQSPETNISKLRSKHTFPPQRLGIISEPHQFVIENSSNAPWDINVRFDEGDRQEFAINHDDCTEQALAPDASCIITATFQPQQSGPRAASFLVQLGKNADAKPLALQGIGATVQAEFRPSEVEFGQQLVVERSDAKTITFKNNGTVAFLVNSITLSEGEDSAAFFIQRDTCSQQVLQPRDNCSLALSFTPTEARNYRTIVEVMDDTGEEIWRIPLIGEGIQPLPPLLLVSYPHRHAYGNRPSNDHRPAPLARLWHPILQPLNQALARLLLWSVPARLILMIRTLIANV